MGHRNEHNIVGWVAALVLCSMTAWTRPAEAGTCKLSIIPPVPTWPETAPPIVIYVLIGGEWNSNRAQTISKFWT
jgi:hypothetical protein